jgi:transcriptional regulator with XRE-family HTH domain
VPAQYSFDSPILETLRHEDSPSLWLTFAGEPTRELVDICFSSDVFAVRHRTKVHKTELSVNVLVLFCVRNERNLACIVLIIKKSKENRSLSAFAINLFLRREAMGWNQEDLAHKSGVSISAVKQLETDRRSPNLATIEALAGALGCRSWDLLVPDMGGTEFVKPPPDPGTTFSHALELLAAFEKAEYDTKRTVLRELGILEKPDPAALLASPRIPKEPQARKTKKKSPV